MQIDALKSSCSAEMQKAEIFEQVTQEQQLLSHSVAENETKQEQEVPTATTLDLQKVCYCFYGQSKHVHK